VLLEEATRSERATLDGAGLLQLFYCTSDECRSEGGWEPFTDDLSRVRVVHPSGPGLKISLPRQDRCFPAKRVVGWTRFIDLPMPSEHEELGLKYTYHFDEGRYGWNAPSWLSTSPAR
jgi:hypothetical protein